MAVADDHDPTVPPRSSRSQWPMPRGLTSPAPSVPLVVAFADDRGPAQHNAELVSLRCVLSSCRIRRSRPPLLTRDPASWLGFRALAPTPAAMGLRHLSASAEERRGD